MVVVDFLITADSSESRKLNQHHIHRIHRLLEAAAYATEALNQLHGFSDLSENMAKQLSAIQRRHQYERELLDRVHAQSKVQLPVDKQITQA